MQSSEVRPRHFLAAARFAFPSIAKDGKLNSLKVGWNHLLVIVNATNEPRRFPETVKMAPSSLPPSSLPSRKRKAAAVEASAAASSSRPKAKSNKSSAKEEFAAKVADFQAKLSSSSDMNPLSDLVTLIEAQADGLPSDAVVPALSLLVRTFSHLMQSQALRPAPINTTSGYLAIPKETSTPQEQVHAWLKGRFNAAIKTLCRLMVCHPKEKTRLAALNGLMTLQKAASEALSSKEGEENGAVEWAECPFRPLVEALIIGRYHEAGEDKIQDNLCQEVRATFILDYVEKYLDVKLAFYRSLRRLLTSPDAPRSAALAVLHHLSNPPSTKAAIKLSPFLVPGLSRAPQAGEAIGGKKKKARGKGKGKKTITQDGDESEADDDSDEEEEEEDLNWFSDSDEEDEDKALGPRKQAKASDTSEKEGGKQQRRRKSARSLALHQAVHNVRAWKVTVDSVWLPLLLFRSPKTDARDGRLGNTDGQGQQLSLGEINSILRVMEKKILPYLSKPQLVADWLIDCLDVGGATALLSLSPLYKLYVSYSLSLPSLYSTLYTLLTPSLLHSPHRSHSLRLIALFLSSEKLPLTIILAFVKRLSRCALRGPPGGIIPVTVMCYNLLKRHKEGMVVLHREAGDEQQGWIDPYLSSLSLPPAETNALRTCLFEFVSLGATNPNSSSLDEWATALRPMESHYHAPTSTIVRILAQPFTKESYDLEEFLDHGYSSLIATEVGRTITATEKARKNLKPPAVNFSLALPGQEGAEEGKAARVRVFPKARAEAQSGDADAAAQQTADDDAAGEDAQEDEEGLDEEEREARAAMREVEREERERVKASQAKAARTDVMTLWAY